MSIIQEVLVPNIGEFEEVEVIEVLVKSGDLVSIEDPLITMESEKATMDVPSPLDCKVEEVLIKSGDKVSQNDLILKLSLENSKNNNTTPSKSTPKKKEEPEKNSFSKHPNNLNTITEKNKRLSPPVIGSIEQKSFLKAHASPSVRKFSRELGVDLSKLVGTGRKGRISKEDVQKFVKEILQEKPSGEFLSSAKGIPELPEIDFSTFGTVEIKPLSRIKKKTGVNLHRSWLNLPIVTHHDEADITELEEFRKSLKEEATKNELKLTPLAFLIKACAVAIHNHPHFNTSLTSNLENLVFKKYLNIGVAVDTSEGLVVPVIKDVEHKGLFELAKELKDISERARSKKLNSNELKGGCFTISSLGGIGGTAFTPLVNAPEVAILGVTRSKMSPVWNGKEFIPRLILPLDLTYDHRVIDGAQAARFMLDLCNILGDMRRMTL
tara:strand:+ start:1680 stop:2993 length:1314 start_codon:yes stop_codon:yes gene_type:complete